MKYTIYYSRKVKAGRTYEMLEIGYSSEFDDAITQLEEAYSHVRNFVDKMIEEEQGRPLQKAVKRPEA